MQETRLQGLQQTPAEKLLLFLAQMLCPWRYSEVVEGVQATYQGLHCCCRQGTHNATHCGMKLLCPRPQSCHNVPPILLASAVQPRSAAHYPACDSTTHFSILATTRPRI
jgi:hypothetical protein